MRTKLLASGASLIIAGLAGGIFGLYIHAWIAGLACFISVASVLIGCAAIAKEPE